MLALCRSLFNHITGLLIWLDLSLCRAYPGKNQVCPPVSQKLSPLYFQPRVPFKCHHLPWVVLFNGQLVVLVPHTPDPPPQGLLSYRKAVTSLHMQDAGASITSRHLTLRGAEPYLPPAGSSHRTFTIGQ
ncbi:protein BONZAI 3 [Platysternon megacephalum]|uniref:Protein BONZAI 3 n=1 Tax=Platysternon megacephalum TaxID=55544 RepID=A0A4D9DKA9_9SAUR|nr:protein BONZAI 3 [Platysternon megacephalum]